MRIFFVAACYMLASCFLLSCVSLSSKKEEVKKVEVTENFIPNEYAKGFALSEGKDYSVLYVFPPFQNSADTLKYIITENGNVPETYANYQIIKVPNKNLVLTSTTQIAMVEALKKIESISAITDPSFVFSPKIKQALKEKSIKTAGQNGQLNLETILASGTDLVVSSAWSMAAYNAYTPLINANIPVVINAEWTEAHPLGRLEWIKVFGVLLGKTQLADSIFQSSKSEYLSLVAKLKGADIEKPNVINGMPYQEAWSIAGGNSYVGTLLKDAGAHWHWENDTSAVSLQLDFETVYEVGEDADYWIAPGRAHNKKEILAIDERFANFNSFDNGQIYNYHNRVNEAGLYDYFESGVVHPEIVLADLVKIFHPEILPQHELFYFKKID